MTRGPSDSQPALAATHRYTPIRFAPVMGDMPWLTEIFGPFLGDWVTDEPRELALDRSIIFDTWVNRTDPAYYAKFRGLDAFLVDLSDENLEIDARVYPNFRGVIRAYWSDAFNRAAVKCVPLGYRSILVHDDASKPATERQYVWSFLGQIDKSSRPDMVRHLASVEPHLLFATDNLSGIVMWNHAPSGPRLYSAAENTAAMVDSIFAPCPMGNVNLESYRPYEALECGAIPILEKRPTLDYYRELWGPHPVPTVRSWKEARTFVRRMIENPAEIDALQQRCLAWWKSYKTQCSREVGEFLDRRSAVQGPATVEEFVLPKFHRKGWKTMELLRHHDSHAFVRRVSLQVTRLLSTGKTRTVPQRPKIR